MKKLFVASFVLAAVVTALAQGPSGRSPAGEPPPHVRNRAATLIGHFNDPQQMLRLAFGLQPPHLVEEELFLQELANPASPQFRRFLTADEWNARFAPSVQDEAAVVGWARSQGLRITQRYPNRLIVDVEAPLGVIEQALNVRINNYQYDGYTYFSNEREPAIPANLALLIRSVGGLNNFPEMTPASFHGRQPPGPIYRPGPVIGAGHNRRANGDRTKLPSALANTGPVPNITNNLYDPTDIYNSNAYNYAALQNQGHCCNPFHAAGGSPPESSIALATFGNLRWNGTDFTDVLGFQNQYPYLAYNVTTISLNGGPAACTVTATQSCGNDGETALDTEWSLATANSFGSYLDTAHVYVYQSGGSTEDMYNAMLNDGHARTFSTSWSCTENAGCASSSTMDTRHNIFNQMAGQGWTMMTASGDRGATDDCATTSVSYPASDPDVIGVGGTLLSLFNDGTFQSEISWVGGTSAKSCSGNNGGSGGGCSVHFSAPGFQSGSSQVCGSTSRSVPDISLNATGGQNYYFNGTLSFAGGTSVSSPMLAGFFAQAEAYLLHIGSVTGNNCGSLHLPCTPIGNANPFLYYFGLNPAYAPHYPFYDITSGCNTNDITAANKLTSYCAGAGYDSVTGWGTANMLQLSWALNTYFAGDFTPPHVTFSGPAINTYFNTPQTVSWSISDLSNNGAVPVGVAGFTKAWDTAVADSTSKTTPGSGDSFYSGPESTTTTGSLTLNSSHEGCHSAHVRAWDNGGSTGESTYGPVCFDDIPPVASCAGPDGLWHAIDAVIGCTASDGLSGLANSADASFTLTTSVAAGTETSNAFTNSHAVLDKAGNSTTEGPIGGNKVDKKAPSIVITTPAATPYIINQAVASNYSCADGGSGLASCAGPVASGSSIDTASVGTKTFTVNAADNVANASAKSVSYGVTYRICLQYDPAKPTIGRAESISLQLCDFNSVNLSMASINVTATAVDGNPAKATPLGSLNPGNVFQYGPTSSPGASYLYLLDTQGLGAGAHVLSFTVQGDPVVHSAGFTLKK